MGECFAEKARAGKGLHKCIAHFYLFPLRQPPGCRLVRYRAGSRSHNVFAIPRVASYRTHLAREATQNAAVDCCHNLFVLECVHCCFYNTTLREKIIYITSLPTPLLHIYCIKGNWLVLVTKQLPKKYRMNITELSTNDIYCQQCQKTEEKGNYSVCIYRYTMKANIFRIFV